MLDQNLLLAGSVFIGPRSPGPIYVSGSLEVSNIVEALLI